MRVIAGQFRGRRLFTPQGATIRPTSDRAREALFDILEHGEPRLRGSRFLDLFCGTGAVGIEACSRGAAEVLLIESAADALRLARANLARIGTPPQVRLLAADAARLGAAPQPFDLVVLDPPYGSGLALPALAGLQSGWLAPGARIVVELAARETLEPPDAFEIEQERRYGAARFVFLRPQKGGRRRTPDSAS
jgi:16S rRNA (guanine966-N2)-methyltransferase